MKKTTFTLFSSLALSTSLFASTISQEIKNNSLVIYNSNIGLVHEEHTLNIKKSEKSIVFENVASTILTDSVNVEFPKTLSLLSQQYKFDKLTQEKLLHAYLNKKVEVRVLKNRYDFQIISATLLALNGTTAIVQTDSHTIITVNSSDIIVRKLPKELLVQPSLVWNVQVQKDTDSDMKIDYIIRNINFKSDYILNIGKQSAELTGWITIENRSGKSFENTQLSLLAGNINRVHNRTPEYKKSNNMLLMNSAPMDVQEVSHEGYHFYSIPFLVNLANNEKTQIKFVTKKGVSIQREYFATLSNPIYARGERKYGVNQYISLEKLDIPLPQGTVRTYSKLNNQTILLGETSIEHTPKKVPLKIRIGENFDVKVTQRVIARDDDSRGYEVDLLYKILNNSDQTKVVKLLIPFNREKDSSIKTKEQYTFIKGNIVEFKLKVDANSIKTFQVHFESKK